MKLFPIAFLILSVSCAHADPAPPKVVLRCGDGTWDEVHQKLFDAGLMFQTKYKICQAKNRELEAKLAVRTSTASRIHVDKIEKKPSFWMHASLFLIGLVTGAVAAEVSR